MRVKCCINIKGVLYVYKMAIPAGAICALAQRHGRERPSFSAIEIPRTSGLETSLCHPQQLSLSLNDDFANGTA
jgi:hypothetical protein